MDLSKYNEIAAEVARYSDPRKFLESLASAYPELKRQTLLCIYDQIYQRKMKITHKKHNSPEKMDEYYFRYCEKSQQNHGRQVIVTMAKEEGLSACLMARIILERHLAYTKYHGNSAPKGEVTQLMKMPWKISDATLSKEIQVCTYSDLLYGPISDKRKQSLGFEHEAILKLKLTQAGIPIKDEHLLQAKGFDKTPDVMLELPIAVDGEVVSWIESKASFGDEELHRTNLRDQYWCYQNRFGPGMVIYWFGFIKELDIHRNDGIILRDSLPESFETLDFE